MFIKLIITDFLNRQYDKEYIYIYINNKEKQKKNLCNFL